MFENILYATDFSESPFMMPCAGIIGSTKKLHLLHVIDEDTAINPRLFEPQMEEAKRFIEFELNRQQGKEVETDIHLMMGIPAREICDVANRVDASLVVLIPHSTREGLRANIALELIKNCDRDLLLMTRYVSDSISGSRDAMERVCTNVFARLLCPTDLSGHDVSAKLEALRAIKREASLGTVTLLNMVSESEKDSVTKLRQAKEQIDRFASDVEALGVPVSSQVHIGRPDMDIITVAEEIDASSILMHARSVMDTTLAVARESIFPLLIIKR